ncbi:inter-alpha-trypsin inhibitor heavy chain H3 isoform X2 [Coffea eugenioides]|uniref:inter-alpha-trypsin inhibitor heavy chain H3 isoform X2 n=1 Tax=Coffea eugenioides TaxID=49369 RepID=UPI000F607E1C|nr:inter-alpha-trypsin inhibitor heavy chain H3 isoform X2 [Coffea eugenioides]
MAEEFARAVEDGLRLSKRIYFGKDRAVAPPKPITPMDKTPQQMYLPTAVMIYAVIGDPAIVDNPDVPSYQPHVHGRCDPPALIPLQMNGVSLEVDCFLDTAFVTVSGSWRVHCVMGSRGCDCRIVIPMGEQGSILGVEVEVPKKSYSTQLISMDDERNAEKGAKAEDVCFLKPHIFTLTIPQVDGGSNLSVKVKWSQKLSYHDGQFTLNIPFSFPDYVTPAGKKISKKEKIHLNVNCGPETEVLCKTTSHPLKELRRQAGQLGFSYESEVLTWSSCDFIFTYNISTSQMYGGALLQSPSLFDVDRREAFCFYLFPGNQSRKVFKKTLIFVIDISGSMRGKPLDDTKNAILSSLSKLDSEDLFNVIAFNGETYIFSSTLVPATTEAIEKVTEWINMNLIAGGSTNILLPLTQAMEMLSDTKSSIPIIFLITDGAVEDERRICDVMKRRLMDKRKMFPRIYTFGIGSFCNHYFLRMLAMIGRGHHDASYDADSIDVRIEGLFTRASSIILANIALENVGDLDEFEVYPSRIPDLSSVSPLIVSGRYQGTFPDTLAVSGIFADISNFSADLKVHHAKDIPLHKVQAKQEIELLTAEAWFAENKELETKIAKLSLQNSVISEFTHLLLLETDTVNKKQVPKKVDPQRAEDPKARKIIVKRNLGVGFGNLTATADNIPPGSDETKPPEAAELIVKAASNCCGKLCDYCCCMCCIKVCSRLNDQCAVVLTQLCGSLACLGCYSCCGACCPGQDG